MTVLNNLRIVKAENLLQLNLTILNRAENVTT